MPHVTPDGLRQNNRDAIMERRKAVLSEYLVKNQRSATITAGTRLIPFSEEYPCPSYFGKKGKVLWDLAIDSYRELTFKPVMLPLLENYVLICLEAQKLRIDVAKNGFFIYKEDRKGDPMMVMRPEADQFLKFTQRMATLVHRLNITMISDVIPAGNPADIIAEKEGDLVGSTSTRSHLLGRETASMDFRKAA